MGLFFQETFYNNMPELPEVETTRRGIEPYLLKQKITKIIIRQSRLRWPIPPCLESALTNQVIQSVCRRGKYLILTTKTGHLLIHLGMSGHLRIVSHDTLPTKHDHFDLICANQQLLRFNDPRRFGAILWTTQSLDEHPLLKKLGPEPLSGAFKIEYLAPKAKNKKVPVKTFIMNSQVVVGVGNIYANEVLFKSKINPKTPAGKIKQARLQQLIQEIKTTLTAAIKQGGTTLKDFYGAQGQKGYFSLSLAVYGRGGKPCLRCKTTLKEIKINQRQTVYCQQCQKP